MKHFSNLSIDDIFRSEARVFTKTSTMYGTDNSGKEWTFGAGVLVVDAGPVEKERHKECRRKLGW